MDLLELMRLVQHGVFAAIAVAALWLWHRQRSRSAALLALAFTALAGGMLWSRFVPSGALEGPLASLSSLNLALIAAFPWLLAAFAWSFEGRLPRPLLAAALPVIGLGAWGFLAPPLVPPVTGTPEYQVLYLNLFAVVWTGLSVATAVHLWRAGSTQRLVRSRMRLMAGGVLAMNAALLVAARYRGPRAVVVITTTLALTAAALFVTGFAPPLQLRLWWRRRSGHHSGEMHAALIGAATPPEIADAVTTTIADLLGGGAAVVTGNSEVLSAHDVDESVLAWATVRSALGEELDTRTRAYPIDDAWLIIRTTPYTPVFGREELELVEAFSVQLRLAFERARLFEANLHAQREAERASAELEATLISLAHDLKSPTSAITGFAHLLEQAASDDERSELIHHIRTNSSYVDELVNALLEFASVGRTQLQVQPVDLDVTVTKVSKRARGTHPMATVRTVGSMPVVLTNPVRMEQMLDNLVGNALSHSGRDDVTITLTSETVDDEIRLVVTDDGQGILPEDRERIFALFQRGRGAARDGSGIGLGMVRRIAESYDGRVELDATADRGSRFVVHLPSSVALRDGASRDTGPDELGVISMRPTA